MSIFEHDDYRTYLRNHIESLPRKGRGELSKIANHLQVNTTLISQIMSGLRNFSQEQAYTLSIYLGHTEIELDYFNLLIRYERAGTIDLKEYLKEKLNSKIKDALKLANRISHEKNLTNNQKIIFYSSWLYSAIHLFSSTKEQGVTLDEISLRFNLAKSIAAQIIQFLRDSGLCLEKSGKYTMSVQSTFVEKGSPYLLKHLSNWRIKSIQKSEFLSNDELMYSGQFSLSKKDFKKLRERFTQLLKETTSLVVDSKAENIACLNLDWYWIES